MPGDYQFEDSQPDITITANEEVHVVEKVKKGSKTKSCSLDPIPIQFLKDCLDALLLTITKLVTLSLKLHVYAMPVNLIKVLLEKILRL